MTVDPKARAIDRLRAAHDALGKSELSVRQAVVDARGVKAGWQGIADELGIAQPNAVRKYKPYLQELAPVKHWEGEADPKAPALVAVRHAHKARKDAELAEVKAVAEARNADITWEVIASTLGVKQPNAIAKYRPLLEEKRTVTVREDLSAR